MSSYSESDASRLFSPVKVGATELSHRIVMAPLTRYRANNAHVPLPFVKDYYTQRGCVPGTLLITEATMISQRAGGQRNIPGIWNQEQIDAWREVVKSVHAAGSKIFMQLWAIGRVATPSVAAEENFEVVSSSAIPVDSSTNYTTPRALTTDEIHTWIADFATAAKNAVHGAGFDGVEIHGANGYLIDQFTKDTCNQRTDEWGGSIENRSRFALEVARAVADAVGADRTAIRLSPFGTGNAMDMADPIPQFAHLIEQLSTLGLAYLHFLWRSHKDPDAKPQDQINVALDAWRSHNNNSPVLLCGWMTPDLAFEMIDKTFKDRNVAIVFGRYFMANPDLVFRIKRGLPVKESDRDDWYRVMDRRGYTDEEFSREFVLENGSWEWDSRKKGQEVVDWGRCNE